MSLPNNTEWETWNAYYYDTEIVYHIGVYYPSLRFSNRIKPSSIAINTSSNIKPKISSKLIEYKPTTLGNPILLVHGFTLEHDGVLTITNKFLISNDSININDVLGGGTGTWGNMAKELSDKGYHVFEFQWRTNAKFEDVAAELAEAISIISQKTSKKTTIIAHSFGGLLARTYLQNYATSAPYNNNVQSLITLGTPHSGISPETLSDLPKGNDLEAIKVCTYLTCHQAGKSIVDDTTTTYETVYNSSHITELFDLDTTPGELIRKLANMESGHVMPVDTLVLIGITIDQISGNIASFQSGDTIISYEGQRFLPSSRLSATTGAYSTINNTSSHYLEYVLGSKPSGLPNAIPGESVLLDDLIGICDYDGFNDCEGYRHMSIPADITSRGTWGEATIDLERNPNHHSWTLINEWLSKAENQATLAPERENITVKFQVINANTQEPITEGLSYGVDINTQHSMGFEGNTVEFNILYSSLANYNITFLLLGFHPHTETIQLPNEYPANGIYDLGIIEISREEAGYTPANICDGFTCSGNGECVVENNLARCECDPGTFPIGFNVCLGSPGCPTGQYLLNGECVIDNGDTCANKICESNSTCNEQTGACECNTGFTLSNCIFQLKIDIFSN